MMLTDIDRHTIPKGNIVLMAFVAFFPTEYLPSLAYIKINFEDRWKWWDPDVLQVSTQFHEWLIKESISQFLYVNVASHIHKFTYLTFADRGIDESFCSQWTFATHQTVLANRKLNNNILLFICPLVNSNTCAKYWERIDSEKNTQFVKRTNHHPYLQHY